MPRANRYFVPAQVWRISHCFERAGRRKTWRHEGGAVKEIRGELGIRAIVRTIIFDGEQQQLRDPQHPYNAYFDHKKGLLNLNISLKWYIYINV